MRFELEEFAKTIPDDNTFDISIKEYINLPPSTRGRLSGYMGKCVNWPSKDVVLDPYVLGLWLGDGHQNGYGFSINSEDDIDGNNFPSH